MLGHTYIYKVMQDSYHQQWLSSTTHRKSLEIVTPDSQAAILQRPAPALQRLPDQRFAYGCFYKLDGPFFGGPYNKSPTAVGLMLGPLIFGNSHIKTRSPKDQNSQQPPPPGNIETGKNSLYTLQTLYTYYNIYIYI